jgi:hypothetical protein
LGPYANTINPATGVQPFPGVNPTPWDYSGGRSSYNALQVSLAGNSWHGLTYLVSYTWSKSMDLGCTGWFGVEGCVIQNPYDINRDWGRSATDVPQLFSAAWVYQVPFGSGQKFSSSNKVVNYILGGWDLNGILSLTSGQPFDIGLGGDPAQTLNFGTFSGYYERLNSVSGQPRYVPNKGAAQWLNVAVQNAVDNVGNPIQVCTGAFTCTFSKFQFGTLKRNSLRSDWFRGLDLSLFKQFPINERYRFEFRFEGFNVFNTPVLGIPDRNVQDPTFNTIFSTVSNARQLQFGVKFYF